VLAQAERAAQEIGAFAVAHDRVETTEQAERAGSPIIEGVAAAEGGHMIASQGAVPIIRNGVVDGACGVGSGTAQQDEDCARAGVAKL